MPVRIRKQSDRLAATLNSPPLTWIWHSAALRKGMMPGSSRWTRAPRESRSRSPLGRMFKPWCMRHSKLSLSGADGPSPQRKRGIEALSLAYAAGSDWARGPALQMSADFGTVYVGTAQITGVAAPVPLEFPHEISRAPLLLPGHLFARQLGRHRDGNGPVRLP